MSLRSGFARLRSWLLELARGRPARIHLREHISRSASKFQRRLSCHRLDVCNAAHAIVAKDFLLLDRGLIETLEP